MDPARMFSFLRILANLPNSHSRALSGPIGEPCKIHKSEQAQAGQVDEPWQIRKSECAQAGSGMRADESLCRIEESERGVKPMSFTGSCAVGSAASTGYGRGSCSFARPPPFGSNWKGNGSPRKSEMKDWTR